MPGPAPARARHGPHVTTTASARPASLALGLPVCAGRGTTNFYLEPGTLTFEEILARADGGVLIQDVTGVHSGANPISGEFSVGATGLRIGGGALGEPLREMTIASTIPEMLQRISGVGDDLRSSPALGRRRS